MKNYIFILLISNVCFSQQALQNSGNIQIHQNGEIGFHIDLINNGTFNQNLGLAGFYNTNNPLSISGTEIPRFFDVEVDVVNHLFLDINTEVANSLAYINGDIITPRNTPNISLDYLENAFYVIEENIKNTDGYASFNGNIEFSFPIGDDDKLRPLITTNNIPNTIIKAAYFNEDPNFPSIFTTSFNTNSIESIIDEVSILEFWDFDGPDNSFVTLTWDSDSDIDILVPDLLSLRVVGWHIADQEWKDLGNSNVTGTLTEGTIDSFLFNPLDYEILTFGSLVTEDELEIYNLFSPNGDGTNETFVIKGIENFENELKIYNRWGNIVYDASNYQNDWDGTSNAGRVVRRNQKLPAGTYFYTLELKPSNKTTTGWLYLNY
ncbi:MAG: gliding motility-associated C-terminal domain-containing protein [Winogradskyella sp.]|uniref:gliding motility-associated C-terminal domain-containing protein n=1 Tax=Winogradskyella sp. TaxID=1883156 RepID=UPI001827FBB7|nr:gliding motility-associated C-terminal domain-containing protein [Winogradskyella sp.]MBT8244061.1 gliding motility-associated C-terminal domain-containing protein [Winogradskyella sp.]NNK23754.1 gliding motility-associated C-terminal domain-containing protein [Winogradskyella sp.]